MMLQTPCVIIYLTINENKICFKRKVMNRKEEELLERLKRSSATRDQIIKNNMNGIKKHYIGIDLGEITGDKTVVNVIDRRKNEGPTENTSRSNDNKPVWETTVSNNAPNIATSQPFKCVPHFVTTTETRLNYPATSEIINMTCNCKKGHNTINLVIEPRVNYATYMTTFRPGSTLQSLVVDIYTSTGKFVETCYYRNPVVVGINYAYDASETTGNNFRYNVELEA